MPRRNGTGENKYDRYRHVDGWTGEPAHQAGTRARCGEKYVLNTLLVRTKPNSSDERSGVRSARQPDPEQLRPVLRGCEPDQRNPYDEREEGDRMYERHHRWVGYPAIKQSQTDRVEFMATCLAKAASLTCAV